VSDGCPDFFWPAAEAAAAVRSRFESTSWEARVVAHRAVDVTTDGSDWVLDEELNTCMVETAERISADGVVTLRWRNPSGIR
jgi:hypothetical protein